MHETSKSIFHRLADSRYATRYFVGQGIDIGAGPDSLGQYAEFFPLMRGCRAWDMPDGDAELLNGVPDASYDFVHSSHCLEHMRHVDVALDNWLRVLKPGGHMVCLIPDEDLYEQGVFPSTFNSDHKHTFSIHKKKSWSARSINVTEMLAGVKADIQVKRIELLDATFRYQLSAALGKRFDQTTTPVGESAIEFIVKKLA